MANLRKGKGLSTSKKAKKGEPNYVENVDFLIGHNPIAGVLQFWYNNTTLQMNFEKQSGTLTPDGNGGGYITVSDSEFYFVVGVTADVTYSVTFDDYGGPGPVTQSGTFEMPLWNVNYAGPDPTNQSGYRNFPAVYQWIPYSGPRVNFPAGAASMIPNFTGTVNVYYAQLVPVKGRNAVPATALRLTFEPVLGSGDEYSSAPSPFDEQQILYPPYAGLGSPNFDMGGGGYASATLPEVVGSFPVNPSGDADFADMIEDIFKSGPAQAGTGAAVAYGDIHHGLGCLDYPGTIQKKVGVGASSLTYDLPNTAGNFLFVLAIKGSGTLGISDSAGNSWTNLAPGLWYCSALAAQSNVVTISNANSGTEITMLEIGGLDTLDGSPVVTSGTGGVYSASIPTTNKPGENSLILSFVVASGAIGAAPFHWKNSTVQANTQVDSRAQLYPNTYQVTYPAFGSGETWTGVLVALKNSQPNTFTSPLGNILDETTLQQSRNSARAYGLVGSLVMDSQKAAKDWLEELCTDLNAAAVWSGFDLKLIPYAEQSYAGNGAIYVSPTASGPVANLGEDDFVADEGEAPVTVSRSAQVDAPNLQQIQSPNRDSNYDQTVTAQPDNGSMSLYGTRKDSPKVFASIQTTQVAQMILGIMVREANIVRNTYSFTLQPKWALLEAMDLVTIPLLSTMPSVNPRYPATQQTIPVRLTSVKITNKFLVQCEAEPFIYGMRSPIANLASPSAAPYSPPFVADPGDVNTPIIFEAVPRLSANTNTGELWLVVNGSNPNYGGCVAYISVDGGSSYVVAPANSGIIQGNATTGVLTSDWPAAADPDTTNNLAVNLTESEGSLDSYSVAEEDAFTYACYVAGGGDPIPYELMSYAIANLTSAYNYTLQATGSGNKLRRAVFGAPAVGMGVDHPVGSQFAFLDPTNPNAAGILRVPLDPTWIGKTLYFKFTAFNTLGGSVESLSDATAYSFTPTGIPGGGLAQNQQYSQSPAIALSQPGGTTIDMAQVATTFQTNTVNYNARSFTIPNPSVPTTYYVTIADPAYAGDVGSGTTLTAYCETTTEKVGVPGYTYIGLIICVPGGGSGATPGPGGWPAPQSAIVTS